MTRIPPFAYVFIRVAVTPWTTRRVRAVMRGLRPGPPRLDEARRDAVHRDAVWRQVVRQPAGQAGKAGLGRRHVRAPGGAGRHDEARIRALLFLHARRGRSPVDGAGVVADLHGISAEVFNYTTPLSALEGTVGTTTVGRVREPRRADP